MLCQKTRESPLGKPLGGDRSVPMRRSGIPPRPMAIAGQGQGSHPLNPESDHLPCVPEELAVPRTIHRTLVPIDLQTQPLLQVPGDRLHHPFPGRLRLHVDVTVVGITAEAVAPPFQRLVQIVQQDVGEQRRQRTALRGPFFPVCATPSIITPAVRYRRITRRRRLSPIRRATRAISTSWFTRSKNFSRSISTTKRYPASTWAWAATTASWHPAPGGSRNCSR